MSSDWSGTIERLQRHVVELQDALRINDGEIERLTDANKWWNEQYDKATLEVERLSGLLGQSMAAHTVKDTTIASLEGRIKELETLLEQSRTH